MAAGIQHGDRQRQDARLVAEPQGLIDDRHRVGQGQGGGEVFDVVVGHGVLILLYVRGRRWSRCRHC